MQKKETHTKNELEKSKSTVVPIHAWPKSKELLLRHIDYVAKNSVRKVSKAAIIHRALQKLTSDDLDQLKEESLTNEDRFEQIYLRDHAAKGMSKEEFYGSVLKMLHAPGRSAE